MRITEAMFALNWNNNVQLGTDESPSVSCDFEATVAQEAMCSTEI
jgi:hypothetical protein